MGTDVTPTNRSDLSRIALSVAAPAYNEAGNIAAAIAEWSTFLDAHPNVSEWEIVVCNDGSTDGTREVLATLVDALPQLSVVELPTNQGAGTAIAAAIGHTRLPWVLLTDSDRQFPIANLDRMLDVLLAQGGVAFSGARSAKADAMVLRVGSWASGALSNLLHRSHCADFNSVFKLVDGPLFRSLHLESAGMNCSTEITARLIEMGIEWVEVPIEHRARRRDARSWRVLRGAESRLLFVIYLGVRQLLLRRNVLRRPVPPPHRAGTPW